MEIYLDLCVYNRPFDDQRQPRVAIETMECILLLSKAISGEMALINSFALEFENGNNPFADRKDIIHELLSTATTRVEYDNDLGARAKELGKIGINAMDAFHLACAEKAKADFFVTCDDILVRKCMAAKSILKVKAKPLMKFVTEEVFKA